MNNPYRSTPTPDGGRIQAGVPLRAINHERLANGLLLRGVVIATYVSDDDGHPRSGATGSHAPKAVYCDVIVYSSIPGSRWLFFKAVLVSQSRGGMHRGDIWKPRAATVDVSGGRLDPQSSNPAYLDGDHVLIGFLNDSLDQPVILRGLPHPNVDAGQEEAAFGQRMKLKAVDGDPEFWRHHGTRWGADKDGNFEIDSTFANNGALEATGKEAAPPTDGKGTQTFKLPQDANFEIILYDMSSPESPSEVMKFSIQKDKVNIQIAQGENLTLLEKDGNAALTLGDGAVKAAIADHLQTFYNTLKGKLDAFDAHKHPSGTGPTGTPDVVIAADVWDTDINSQKLTFPDN
jgi:hypothetical protein